MVLCALLAPQGDSAPFSSGQRWMGFYRCAQGYTHLEVRVVSSMYPNSSFQAIFDFIVPPPSGCTGQYYLNGQFNALRSSVVFVPGAWIFNPCGYGSVGITYSVMSNNLTMSGTISNSACGLTEVGLSTRLRPCDADASLQSNTVLVCTNVSATPSSRVHSSASLTVNHVRSLSITDLSARSVTRTVHQSPQHAATTTQTCVVTRSFAMTASRGTASDEVQHASVSNSLSPSREASASSTFDVPTEAVPATSFASSTAGAVSAAIGVLSGAIMSGAGSAVGLPMMQLVTQNSELQARCNAADLPGNTSSSSPDPLMSDFIDNPLQIHFNSFGRDLAYLGGSMVGNTLLGGIFLLIKIAVNGVMFVLENESAPQTNLDAVTHTSCPRIMEGLFVFVWRRRCGLPGVLWEPLSMVSQSVVAAAAAVLCGGNGSHVLLVVLSCVSIVIIVIAPFVWFVHRIVLPTELFAEPVPIVSSGRSALAWGFHPWYKWELPLKPAQISNTNVAESTLIAYEAILESYARDRHWFFVIEVAVSIGCGAVNGLSMGLEINAVCDMQWSVTVALLILCSTLFVSVAVLRPFNTPANTALVLLSTCLTIASLTTLLVTQVTPLTLNNVTDDLVMMQSSLSLSNIVMAVYRLTSRVLRRRVVIATTAGFCHQVGSSPSPTTSTACFGWPASRYALVNGRLHKPLLGDGEPTEHDTEHDERTSAQRLDDVRAEAFRNLKFGIRPANHTSLEMTLQVLVEVACRRGG